MGNKINLAFCLAIILVFGIQSVTAQKDSPISPPLGPANHRSELGGIAFSQIKEKIEEKAREVVAEKNAEFTQNGESYRLIFKNVSVGFPTRQATKNSDRPNQWYVQIPMTINIEIDIPTFGNRQLSIGVMVNNFCESWYTGDGNIKISAVPYASGFSGGSIIEQFLTIKDNVDARIASKLSLPGTSNFELGFFKCTTIGFTPGISLENGQISFDFPVKPSPNPKPELSPKLEIRFLKLKRLIARDLNGSVLYEPVENVILETYSNHTFRRSSTIMMLEDGEVNLNISPVVMDAKSLDKMILIANIKQQNYGLSDVIDSNYAISYRNSDFSPGTHTIKIDKLYSTINPQTRKVTYWRTPAYELTYHIRVSQFVGGNI